MELIKRMILNWCIAQVINNVRNVPPQQLRIIKAKLTAFNAVNCLWDTPPVRKQKEPTHEEIYRNV